MARKDLHHLARGADAWAGTVQDVADVARVAIKAMNDGGVQEPNVDIAVETLDGPMVRELVSGNVDEFLEKIAPLDETSIWSISVWAWCPRGHTASEDQSVHVKFGGALRPAVYIDVKAPAEYEQFVIAADAQLARAVEVRERRLPNFDRIINIVSVILGVASSAVSALADKDQTAWKVVGLGLVVAAAAMWALRRLVRWLFPPFELLPEGGHARTRRIIHRARSALIVTWPLWGAFFGALAALLLVRTLD